MKPAEHQKFVGAVQAAVKIMRRLAEVDQAEGVASIARATGLNVSTTFNILKTLTKERLVTFDDRTKAYDLGLGVLDIAMPVMGRPPAELIRPLMEEIAERHQTSVALWHVTDARRVVMSDHVAPSRVVHAVLRPGARFPDLAGAVGRCVAAHREYDRDTLEREFAALRWQNPPSFDTYWAEVQQARQDGYAIEVGQLFRGITLIASVACDAQGAPRLGLSAVSIAQQIEDDRLADVARDLSTAVQAIERGVFGVTGGSRRD
ncbi:hypothetical protein ATO6_01750 [Oceanicola sp. 22II-s10i]|uniref:IclR family transcriptional regulator n=1 Tax=Oceanicola sp. 22II-s10i TaxID=1317116 RepID=UPI000B521B38|nr:helix-turn-helix domain-containing protein [Oceanicola sp. 22II-s10i]OWU85678.1 hypothetical protein ATO6_01750 [Oceanicola sp. 22II-s10i]